MDDPTFLAGGAVGALMRAHDWSHSPLGPPSAWPQSLRSVVSLMLGSKFPMFVAWGPQLGVLYNDAYAEVLGGKHPTALGARFGDVWSEIWPDISPLVDAALAGEASYREDLPLLMNRRGFDEQTWFTFSYSPVRDETGRVAGMFCACFETTDRVLTEWRQALMVELDERLRDLDDPDEIAEAAAQVIGRGLKADRAHWAAIDEADGSFEVREEWTAPGIASLVGRHRLSDFGDPLIAEMRGGATVTVDDTLASASEAAQAVQSAFGRTVRGALATPLIRGGVWQAAFCLHTVEPRTWREDEREVVRAAAEHAWTAVKRAEAERQMRASEARFRALVSATSDVIYRMSPDWIEMRQLDGRGFIADTDSPSIAWQDVYLFPEDQPHIGRVIHEAIRTRTTFQLEHRVRQVDGSAGWTFSRAVPVIGADGEIVEWFGMATDVTARKLAEEHLRLMVNELNHRVKNSLATVQAIAAQTLRRSEVPPGVRESLTERLLALARAHDVLTDENWSGADLRDLAELAAEPYRGADGQGRIQVAGPAVELPPKTAIAMALAFHELATNAVKYGALSTPNGRVEVAWATRPSPDGRRLRLTWRERGGPRVTPPASSGFGTRLLQRGLAADLQGSVVLDYQPEGLVCVVEALAPLAAPGRPLELSATSAAAEPPQPAPRATATR